jgi:RNA polymerase sigma factor (sigma-70 family)
MAEPDPTVVAAAARGDHEAFRAIVLATQGDLRIAIAARAGVPDLVDEILQRTYIAAWEALPRYRPEAPLMAWLRGIARNQTLVELRTRARRRQTRVEEIADLISPDPDNDEGDAAEAHLAQLRRCLSTLAPQAQEILRRRYGDGQDLARLAVAYKRPAGALAQYLQRLRDRLRACVSASAP